MWEKGWREQVWNELNQEWDVIVIGGGITGAGVFRRSVAEGFNTLLVDAADFSFGTSSRSSKLVHGGIRYLRNRQFNVTREAVHEREWMLREARELVTPLQCLMPYYQDQSTKYQFALGMVIYDLLAPKWKHYHLSKKALGKVCPPLISPELGGGFSYYDAQMDDSRLVLTLIRQAVRSGGTAVSYACVTTLLKDSKGRVCGIVVKDQAGELPEKAILGKVVINATGPWSDTLRKQVDAPARLRLLRGSHVVFRRESLPLPSAITMVNPRDRRAMFAIPWEGRIMIGTTDLDHRVPVSQGEPFASREEVDYILDAANAIFPNASLHEGDILSSFAGLRPVINTGKASPSQESRAHVVWDEEGLITVTGGKLTTFRIMAEQALQLAAPSLRGTPDFTQRKRYFDPLPQPLKEFDLNAGQKIYLLGRYGVEAATLLQEWVAGENSPIDGLPNLWSELRYNSRHGGVMHLDDLLLRRVRLGLLLQEGGKTLLPRIRQVVQEELGWDDPRWKAEESRYCDIYDAFYAPSPTGILTENNGEEQWQNSNVRRLGMRQESPVEPIVLS